MNIKKQIKNYDITLSTLADNLFISRPTLNSYIYLYENNKKIPSRRYQIIFDKLFSKEKTIKEFYDILKRYNKLLAKDEILEITELSPEYSDLISAVVKDMRNDLLKEAPNGNIYAFIRMIINHYRKLDTFVDLSNYFLTLNGISDYNQFSNEEKKRILLYYDFFTKIKSKKININFNVIEKSFARRIEERKKENRVAEEQLKERISKLINEQLNKEIAAGKPIEEIDLNDIIRKINIKNNGS